MERKLGYKLSAGSIKEASHGNCSNKKEMMKESLEFNSLRNGEEFMNGFSWPPRSYNCSFCKREFRSAQALGGHMNVHRRDRARLRQYSPPTEGQGPNNLLNLNHNPNPNSNPNLISASPLSLMSSSSTPRLKPLVSPALSSPELKKWVVDGIVFNNPLDRKAPESAKIKKTEYLCGIGEYDHAFATEDGCKILKKAEIIRLDLGIGLINDSKDDLDLELRLGNSYSN